MQFEKIIQEKYEALLKEHDIDIKYMDSFTAKTLFQFCREFFHEGVMVQTLNLSKQHQKLNSKPLSDREEQVIDLIIREFDVEQ